jgi:hypothetical protein
MPDLRSADEPDPEMMNYFIRLRQLDIITIKKLGYGISMEIK